jgi:poly(hydroxyalkanoate) depolymerase family esterase
MTINFAGAMRRATQSTRALDVVDATRIIQEALAGKAEDTSVPTEATSRPSSGRVADTLVRHPDAEIIEPDAPEAPPRSALRPSSSEAATRGQVDLSIPGMRGLNVKSAPPLPDGAAFVSRSFTCAAGSRTYKLYTPASAPSKPNGLIVMLHGCTQNPDNFATGTAMNAVAEKNGLIVAYPCQTAAANPSACWSWFNPADQTRDRGEPAIIAGITRDLMQEFAIAERRTFVAGLSAGGAMAAIMGELYPDLYAGVGVHSGLAYGSAHNVVSAMAAMRGERGKTATSAAARPTRTIIFHGSADHTVHPSNADRVFVRARREDWLQHQHVEQLRVNGRLCTRTVLQHENASDNVEYWKIEGAGHAWSGGNPAGSFADASGPDASTEMVRFFLGAS